MVALSTTIESLSHSVVYLLNAAIKTAQMYSVDTKGHIVSSHVLDDTLLAEVGVEQFELIDEHLRAKSLFVGSQPDRGVVELSDRRLPQSSRYMFC